MINSNTKTLSNGIRLVTAPNSSTEAVTILIQVGAGARFEKPSQIGMTHFLEHLFFKGSKAYPTAFDISREFDSIGAYYNAHPSEESTVYYVQSSAKDFAKAFAVISDMYLNPIFDEKELQQEKNVVIAEINMHRDMPQSHVQTINQQQMFAGHPLGYDLAGTKETINSMTRTDAIEFRKLLYSPENTIIAICGNPGESNWEQEVEKLFSVDSRGSKPEIEKFTGSVVKDKYIEEVRKIDQAHIVLSYLSISKHDPRKYVMSVLKTILGGGMSSRLFMQVRERRGLAYYVQADATAYQDTGIFSVISGIHPDKVSEGLKVILNELDDLSTNGPNQEELDRAKGNIRGSIALSLENSPEIAAFLSDDLLSFGKTRTIDEILSAVDRVSLDDVKMLAKEIFTKDRMGLSIIGPKSYNNDLKEII